ncbi:hypothetical protein ACFV4K_28660 [Nocardia sp. NPDC059764]|uniref:hypothetical protein n=1 Tax=Nocardia sp. NPDC059764 TaxID=3346939 RepID=UPI003647E03E
MPPSRDRLTTSSSGDSTTTHTHRFIVVLVLLDRPHPWLAVQRRGLMSQFGRALFGDKPTATGNVMFDAQYQISAADASHAKAMISPPLIAAHIANAVPQWTLQGNGLLGYFPAGKFNDPNLIPGYAGPLLHVADLLGPVDFAAPVDRWSPSRPVDGQAGSRVNSGLRPRASSRPSPQLELP